MNHLLVFYYFIVSGLFAFYLMIGPSITHLFLFFILFYRNDSYIEGGESILLDCYPVVKEMREKYPKHFDTLTKVPVTFQRYYRGK